MSSSRPDPMALADVLARKHQDLPNDLFTQGVVYDASSTTSVQVDVNNSVITVPKIDMYNPVVGDVVVLMGPPGSWVCVGSLSPTTAGSGSGAVPSHTHAETDVTSLQSDLAGKAAASHTHAESAITNLTTDLAGKAAASHSHAESDVANLASDLASKVSTGDSRLSDARAWSLYTSGGETSGQVPSWNGSKYVPTTVSTGGTTDSVARTALFGGASRTTEQIIDVYYAGNTGGVAQSTNVVVSGNWQASKDTDSMYSNSGSIYMQAAVAGRFHLWGSIVWGGAAGAVVMYFLKNGTALTNAVAYDSRTIPGAGAYGPTKVSEEIILAVGDKIYLMLYTAQAGQIVYGSGSPLLSTTGLYTRFGMHWIASS